MKERQKCDTVDLDDKKETFPDAEERKNINKLRNKLTKATIDRPNDECVSFTHINSTRMVDYKRPQRNKPANGVSTDFDIDSCAMKMTTTMTLWCTVRITVFCFEKDDDDDEEEEGNQL